MPFLVVHHQALAAELIHFSDLTRLGAFRLPGGDANYARGVIEVNPANQSFYMVGHEHRNELAEYGVPGVISSSANFEYLGNSDSASGISECHAAGSRLKQ